MPLPKGKLIVICGFRSDGSLRALEVTDDDELKVALASAAQGLVGGHGWIAGDWQRNPLSIGYSGDGTGATINADAPAGIVVVSGSAVPAGEIWSVQAVAAKDSNSIADTITLQCVANGTPVPIQSKAKPAANEYIVWSGSLVIAQGDYVRAVYTGVILHDALELYYHYMRVDIDQ